MSRFDSMMALHGAPILMEQIGRSVVYKVPDADDLTLTALVGAIEARDDEAPDGRRRRNTRTVTISTDPNSADGGVADPQVNAVVVIDTVEWAVKDIRRMTGALVMLELERAQRLEVSRDGYRRGA